MDSVNPTPADFGFQPVDIGAAAFIEAERLFLSSLSNGGNASKLDYERKRVLENQDAFYFPVGWIGCSGHLVTKNPLRPVSFGSYVGPGAHIWAYYQGISMEAFGNDRKNKLRILSVRDVQNTVSALKSFLNPRWVDGELLPRLSALPTEIEGVDLYFGIRSLLEAQSNDWFRFEVSK